MSNATLKVRFCDGLILYGQYHGTSDICHPNLFDSEAEAWAHRRQEVAGSVALGVPREGTPEPEPVEIYSDYGGGWYWGGKACRKTKRLTANLCGYEGDELPSWPSEEQILDVRDSRKRLFADDWARD
jgi:hypothetical protein